MTSLSVSPDLDGGQNQQRGQRRDECEAWDDAEQQSADCGAGNGKEALMGDDEVEVRAAAERLVPAKASCRLDDY